MFYDFFLNTVAIDNLSITFCIKNGSKSNVDTNNCIYLFKK